MKKNFLLLILIAISFVACNEASNSNEQSTSSLIEFTVLQLNDVYEIAPLDQGKAGGMARVAQIRKELLAENNNTITVLSGDFVSPSLIGTLKADGEKIAGAQMVDVMNSTGVDYVTFGNHEFDLKENQLLARLNESEFTYTTVNAFHRIDSVTVKPFEQNGVPVPNYIIHEVKGEQGTMKVGFIGCVLPFNKQDFVSYTDVDSSMLAVYEEIKGQCDVVLGITHLEMEDDKKLAAKMQAVPLFIGGHDHTHMNETVNNTTVAKADANARTVYIHRFKFDPATKSTSFTSELKTIDESVASDPNTEKLVKKWTDLADTSMVQMGYDPYEVIYHTDVPLDGRESSIRWKPTNLGQIIVGAMHATDTTYDVALLNSGSIRVDDQLMNDIMQYDILRTLPFGGGLSYTSMTGDELERTLQIGLVENVGIGGYLQTSGVDNKAGGYNVNGNPIDPTKTYRVIGTDFLMAGGEKNLEYLKQLNAVTPDQTPNGIENDIRTVTIDYLKKQ